jgi:hypothetical protein
MAGAGSIPLSSAIVSIALWAFHVTPPQEIVLAMQGLASAALAYAAIYFTPHNPPPPAPQP